MSLGTISASLVREWFRVRNRDGLSCNPFHTVCKLTKIASYYIINKYIKLTTIWLLEFLKTYKKASNKMNQSNLHEQYIIFPRATLFRDN